MFTIEHGFDATTITLLDDGPDTPLKEDVLINGFDDIVTLEQWDARTDRMQKINLSMSQIKDLAAALDLPEGVYQRARE